MERLTFAKASMAALSFALGIANCSSRPPPTVHCAEPAVVAYPPPPAQVELAGVARDAPCEWMDGSWEWIGRRWQWKPGSWIIPPPGCSRAAPITIWLQSEGSGVLYYRAASFCPIKPVAKGPPLRCAAPKPCPGTADAGPPGVTAVETDAARGVDAGS